MEFSPDTSMAMSLVAFLVLAACFLYLSTIASEDSGPRWWAAAYAAAASDHLIVLMLSSAPEIGIFIGEILHGAFVVLLFYGVSRFLGRDGKLGYIPEAWAMVAGWSAISLFIGVDPLWRALPLSLMAGGLAIYAGGLLAFFRPQLGETGYRFSGALLILWGLHRLDGPFLHLDPALVPWGTLLTQGLALAMGVGLMLTMLQRLRHRALRSEKEASAHRRQVQTILETSPIAVAVARPTDGKVLFANSKLGEVTGATEVTGSQDPGFSSGFQLDPSAKDKLLGLLKGSGKVDDVELFFRKMDGEKSCFLVSADPITYDGEPALLMWLYDITERKGLETELRRYATIDSLTGACNRRHYLELSQKEVDRGRRYSRPVSVLILDVDRFKRINDTHGHPVGDEVLRRLTAKCREELRDQDILGRLGGEEFAVTLPETDIATAHEVAERLRCKISEMVIDIPEKSFSITLSFGVAQCSSEGESMEDCLARADKALYKAKNNGRNMVVAAA